MLYPISSKQTRVHVQSSGPWACCHERTRPLVGTPQVLGAGFEPFLVQTLFALVQRVRFSLYPRNHVGCGWGIGSGETAAVRLPKILVLIMIIAARAPRRAIVHRFKHGRLTWPGRV